MTLFLKSNEHMPILHGMTLFLKSNEHMPIINANLKMRKKE